MSIICFDLDNTLVYSMKAYYLALNLALKECGLRRISSEKFGEFFGRSNKFLLKKTFPDLRKQKIDEILILRKKMFMNITMKYIEVIPGVKNTLKELSKKYVLVLLSNSKHKNINLVLKKVKINPRLFKLILGSDDVGAEKPSPMGIKMIEKKLRKKVDYIVGDTPIDILTGKKSKIKSIAVLTGVWSRDQLKKYKPFKIIKNVNELSGVI